MSKLLITVGLPASGKTTFAENYAREKNNGCYYSKIKHINIDELKESCYQTCETTEQIIRDNYSKSCHENIIDGLFLNTEDVIKAFKSIETNNVTEIEVHYWNPNVTNCLFNDANRRNKPSKTTIENAKITKPNIKKIEEETGVKTKIITHETEKKPYWKIKSEKLDVHIRDEKYLFSDEWCLGGTQNNFWGDSYDLEPDEPKNFDEFDQLLEKICPTITFLQYKHIYSQCVDIVSREDSDYYGGCATYAQYRCDLEQLFKILKEKGLMNEK